MTQPTKQFKKVSKDFIHDALKICFQNKDLLKEDTEYFPEMQLGSYKKLIKKSVINYDYFVEELISEELEKLEMFQLLNLVLSSM